MILLTIALVAPGVSSQEVIVPLQFSYSDPGARSLGFGGAFVALADDATAAFSNPAGLVQLLRSEVSIEARGTSYATPFTKRGRVEGLPSGFGIDTTVGLRTATSHDDLTGIAFLSLVYPGENWSLALFRHTLADFEFHSETQGLFGGGTNCCQIRIFDQRATSQTKLTSYGISGGYRISERIAVGLGVAFHDGSFDASATSFRPDETPAGVLGPTSFLPERSVLTERNFFDDTDWAFSAGVLWRLSERWTIGGIYREGPEFELAAEIVAREAGDFGAPPGSVLFEVSGLTIELPSVVGLGFSYRAPNDRLTVTFQWDRVEYSSIVDSLPIDGREIDDVDELHLGAEYVFLDSKPIIALRLGTWLEPDHQLRDTTDEPFLRALLPRGDDNMHYTAGLGVAFQRFQIDLGIDISDRVDTLSLSGIYTF